MPFETHACRFFTFSQENTSKGPQKDASQTPKLQNICVGGLYSTYTAKTQTKTPSNVGLNIQKCSLGSDLALLYLNAWSFRETLWKRSLKESDFQLLCERSVPSLLPRLAALGSLYLYPFQSEGSQSISDVSGLIPTFKPAALKSLFRHNKGT